jgi:hypothetical protein
MQALATTTERVPEGLLLAQPVLDAHAQLLLPEGTPVTREILNNLQHRGIDTIFVNAPEELAQRNGKVDPVEHRVLTEQRLLHLFRPALRAGQLNPLLHMILRHRLEERP